MNSYLRYNPKPLHGNPSLQAEIERLLKLCCNMCQAKTAFFISWEDAMHLAFHHQHGSRVFYSTEFHEYEERLSTWAVPYFSANNLKYHTLFQDLPFFNLYDYNQLLAVPVDSSYGNSEGFWGLLYDEDETIPDHALDCIKQFANHIQERRIDLIHQQDVPDINQFPMPAFLLKISNKRNEIVDYKENVSAQEFIQLEKLSNINTAEQSSAYDLLNLLTLSSQDLIKEIMHNEDNKVFDLLVNSNQAYALAHKNYHLRFQSVQIDHYTYCWACIQDVTIIKEYEESLDKILFDISHILRRPVATLSGLTQLIDIEELNEKNLRLLADKLKIVSGEMDQFIKLMFNFYQYKRDLLG